MSKGSILLLSVIYFVSMVHESNAFSTRRLRPSQDCSRPVGGSVMTQELSSAILGASAAAVTSTSGTVTNVKNVGKTSTTTELFSSATNTEVTNADLDWRQVAKDAFREDKRPIILFDGVCNLCNGGVNFALDNDSIGEFRFASLQSETGQSLLLRSGKKANDISSIVLVTEDKSYFKSEAVLRIATKLDGNPALPVVGIFGRAVPSFMRNVVYDFVADNRYRFGEADQCRLDSEEFDDRFVADP
jgi:predicted DCC family thiol-disulfide oxidoreductase YuxK